ncbi:MAG: phage tail protein [Myxococcota bacterium]
MSYFDQAFEKSFPKPAPWQAYSWEKLVKDVKVTKLETSVGQTGGGSRVPMAVKRVTKMKLVTSYRFVKSIWHRVAIVKKMPPPMSLLHHMSVHAPGKAAKGASSGRRTFDPYGDFAFHVEIEGIGAGAFRKFDGIDVEIDQIEYKDSMDPYPHKRPGIYRFGNIKLTKGVIANKALWDWCNEIMQGNLARKNGSIHVLSDNHDKNKAEITYNFYQAWPCKWSGLRLDGKGNETLVEEIELCVDYVTRSK